MSIKKRILPILLILALVPSLMAVPAAAASTEDVNYINFLASTSYVLYRNGLLQAKGVDFPNRYVSTSSKTLSWQWNGNTFSDRYSVMYFTLYCGVKPDKVVFSPYGGRDITATFIGSNGMYYQYVVTQSSNLGAIAIAATWNSGYIGHYGIYSCVGFLDVVETVSKINYYPIYYTPSGTRIEHTSKINATLPVSDIFAGAVVNDFEGLYEYRFDLLPEQHGFSFMDSVYFNASGMFGGKFDAVLVSLSGDDVKSLPVTVTTSTGSDVVYGASYQYPECFYSVDIDLNGIDMRHYILQITWTLEGARAPQDTVIFSGTLIDFYINPVHEKMPWYRVMFKWLDSSISKVGSSIVSAIDELKSVFGNNGELDQAGDAMSSQADTMQQANDQMAAVERPAIDPDNLLGNLLNFSPGGMVVLSSMTSNNFVPQLMVVVFTFALCGYIFFGKRR